MTSLLTVGIKNLEDLKNRVPRRPHFRKQIAHYYLYALTTLFSLVFMGLIGMLLYLGLWPVAITLIAVMLVVVAGVWAVYEVNQ